MMFEDFGITTRQGKCRISAALVGTDDSFKVLQVGRRDRDSFVCWSLKIFKKEDKLNNIPSFVVVVDFSILFFLSGDDDGGLF